jgi:hypothetical protein
MNTALFPKRPHYYAPAMVALTPFHPLKVTVANILLLEGTLAHHSLRHESIRMATLKHYAIAAVSPPLARCPPRPLAATMGPQGVHRGS